MIQHDKIESGVGKWVSTQTRLAASLGTGLSLPLIQSGGTYFGVGGALGFDTMMADLLLELKKENSRMRIIEVLPFEGYRAKWTPEQQLHAKNLDRQMDKIVYVSKEPSRGAYLARNRHLVDGSRYCICYCSVYRKVRFRAGINCIQCLVFRCEQPFRA